MVLETPLGISLRPIVKFHPLFAAARCVLCALCIAAGVSPAGAWTDPGSVRVGWQTPWATQGQVVMGLEHSNIAKLVNLNITYVGFQDGPRLNQAAAAGQVDVLLTADQPALALLNLRPQYRIVGRLMYNRVCLYVPAKSPIGSLRDVANKRVFGPIGAAAERVALSALQDAGVDLGGVAFGALDMAQQAALIERHAKDGRWEGADALYGFDPLPAIWEQRGLIRNLNCGEVVAVIVASPEMVTKRRADLEAFLAGFVLAWHLFGEQPEKLNTIYSEQSGLNASNAALDLAASVEPNRWTTDIAKVRITFNKDDIDRLRQASRFLASRGVIPDAFDPAAYMDNAIADQALRRFDVRSLAASTRIDPQPTN